MKIISSNCATRLSSLLPCYSWFSRLVTARERGAVVHTNIALGISQVTSPQQGAASSHPHSLILDLHFASAIQETRCRLVTTDLQTAYANHAHILRFIAAATMTD